MNIFQFEYLVIAWIGVAIFLLPLLFRITAPYGRHSKTSWGPMIPNRLGWILMELPSLLLFAYLFLTGTNEPTQVTWVFFGCWVVHYINRSLIFPLRTRTTGKKMPFIIMLLAIFFNLANAGINGYYLGFHPEAIYPESWLTNPYFLIGISVFLIGFFINQQSDHILLNLRKPGETGYKIPHGEMFRFISCPNHFGEMVEWIGFALMTCSLAGLSFAIWTAANLLPRALDHHKWYLKRFEEYPKERKAVIPFIL